MTYFNIVETDMYYKAAKDKRNLDLSQFDNIGLRRNNRKHFVLQPNRKQFACD